MAKELYKVKQIYTDTYAITDYGFDTMAVYMYLLIGENAALLIDCGYGILDIKKIIREITDKPLICACTHGHLDHALGAGQFEKAYMHSKDSEVYARHTDPEFLRMTGNRGGILTRVSKRKRNDPAYQKLFEQFVKVERPKKLLPLEEQQAFELGNRRVTWYPLPGHTPGNVAFYDEKYNALFDGDGASYGFWIFLDESLPLSEYRSVLEGYIRYAKGLGNPNRFCGHKNTPSTVKDLEKLLACVDVALMKKPITIPLLTPLGDAQVLFAKGGMMFYNKNKLR
ncbi:MAG: MBL fold metallo-hydrolase [Spirochaetaceae bacterium]|jgi:glyoxylase-like metal-dependent hydrolase (beta-lactamase superfamily II)|nr:MBL fold metallo-hydrolase [Spirochaetaceae bacterium]